MIFDKLEKHNMDLCSDFEYEFRGGALTLREPHGMALFYFHLCDGVDRLLDPEGREIAEMVLIPDIALREARAIISHEVLLGSIVMAQAIEVRDASDAVVHRLEFRDAVTFS